MNEAKKNYYQTLGITSEDNLNSTEIEKIYRRLYIQYYSESEEAREEKKTQFETITRAYESLLRLEKGKGTWKKNMIRTILDSI